MSTDFVADQVITAEDLSNICVDLGATEYTDFSTLTPPLAVNELNKITMDLVSKGILLTLNRCQVTCEGDVITVAEGVCVFENGAKIRLTEPKTISKMASGATYVYFFNNVAESKAGLYAASEPPTEGDFVLLALVSAGGVVTDKREYARGKSTYAQNQEYRITKKFVFSTGSGSINNPAPEPAKYNFEIPFTGWNYFGINGVNSDTRFGIVKLEENVTKEIYGSELCHEYSLLKFWITKNGKFVHIECQGLGLTLQKELTLLFI